MKKILVTRRLLRSCEDRAKEMFDANLNLNDELYSQKKLIEMSQGCDGILSALTDQMEISIKYSKLDNIKASPTLFFEFHGSENSNNESIGIVEEISKSNGGSDFQWASSPEEQKKLWKARHDVYYSVKALGNDMKVYSTDVCVPISRLVECISWAEKELSLIHI